MSTKTDVTTFTIVNNLQEMLDEVKQDKKRDLAERVKMVVSLTSTMLRAGALNVSYQKVLGTLPEEVQRSAPSLSGPIVNESIN